MTKREKVGRWRQINLEQANKSLNKPTFENCEQTDEKIFVEVE